MNWLYGCPGRLSTSANLKPAPTDHTHAIAEAAREYVAAIRSHDEGAWPSLKTKLAVWDAKEALVAAVEAESGEREVKP